MKLFRQSQYGDLLNLYHEWLCLLSLLKLTIQLWFSIKHSVDWCRFFFGRRILYRYYEFTTAFDMVSSFPNFVEIIKMRLIKQVIYQVTRHQ